jgi:hypothetical protein
MWTYKAPVDSPDVRALKDYVGASTEDRGEQLARTTGDVTGAILSTRQQLGEIAAELEARGWTITGGGGKVLPDGTPLKEEYIRGIGGSRLGASYPDITAVKNGRTLRINTIDTYADGVTATTREARNAARIRQQLPGEHLVPIQKPKLPKP